MRLIDLMIGDWVLVNGTPMQIEAIDDIDGEIMAGDELYCLIEDRVHSEDKIEPIPLTAEILEKNGFERSYSNILTADGYKKLPQYKYKNMAQVQDICRNLITISYSDLKGGVYDIQCGIGSHIYDLKYVHQLQHALRLCGIDKDIVL